jgi:hypothetical protein
VQAGRILNQPEWTQINYGFSHAKTAFWLMENNSPLVAVRRKTQDTIFPFSIRQRSGDGDQSHFKHTDVLSADKLMIKKQESVKSEAPFSNPPAGTIHLNRSKRREQRFREGAFNVFPLFHISHEIVNRSSRTKCQ